MIHQRRVLFIALIAILTLAVAVTGCAGVGAPKLQEVAGSVAYDYDMAEEAAMVEAPAASAETGFARGMAYDGVGEAEAAEQEAARLNAATAERMIIRTVNMSIVVEDTDETMAAIRDAIRQFDGYVADSNRWMVGNQAFANLTLRIPAESLDAVLDTVRGMAIRVESENSSGQDVTEEFFDLQARLRNLEATETELLALLTEVRENRGKAEDILAIHRELTNIRSQIESLQGRSQYLERMTALATLRVEIRPRETPVPVVEPAQWSPLVTLNRALRAFVSAFQVLLDLAIYVVIFSPFVLIPVAVLWLPVRALQRRRRNRREGPTTSA